MREKSAPKEGTLFPMSLEFDGELIELEVKINEYLNMPIGGIIRSEGKNYPFIASSVEVDTDGNYTFSGAMFSDLLIDINNNKLKSLPHFTLRGRSRI